MNLGKVKSFLIVLFLGINIYLVFSLVMSTRFFISRDTVESTVDVLEKNGISIDKDIIIKSVVNLKNTDTNNVIYTKKFRKANEDGLFSTEGDVFFFETDSELFYRKSDAQLKTDIKRLLADSGFETKHMRFGKVYYNEETRNKTLKIRCYIGSYEVFDSNIKVVVSEDKLTLRGRWYEPLSDDIKSKSRSRDTVYVTSVLVSMLQNEDVTKNVPLEIRDIDYGYLAGTSYGEGAHVTTSALPYYRIKDSNGNVYYYDAKNGLYLK